LNQKIGESGGGKSGLNMNFGLCKGNIVRAISEGTNKLNVTSADTIVRALLCKEVSAVCVGVSVLRENATERIEGKQIKDSKFQSHSTRIYKYDDFNKPVEAYLHEQSFLKKWSNSNAQCNHAKPSKTIKLDKIWSNSNAQCDHVISDVEIHTPLPFPLTKQFPVVRERMSMAAMIKRATTIHTSRKEKETALNNRKEEAALINRKEESVKNAQYHLDVVRTEKIRKAAEARGCNVHITRSTLG
jgi:hypothetical protein